MKLGIIGAMEIEVGTLKGQMNDRFNETFCGMEFSSGSICGVSTVVVQCGIGKVNAAICTQILCDRYQVDRIINTGVAGSLSNELDIGDLVIAKDVVHHDMDVSALGYSVGQVPGIPVYAFDSDEALAAMAYAASEQVNAGHTKIGRIASGDQFVACRDKKDKIIADTQAICTEMEGAAIAHTAWRNQIPFAVIRAISDKADASAEMDYPTFEVIAAERCANVVIALAKMMNNE